MLSDGSISLAWSRLAGWSIPLAFVLVFVKVDFQPSLTIHGASADPADVAVLLTVLCALVQVRSQGLGLLRRSLAVWVAAALFLAFIAAASLYPRLSDSHYAWATHLVTAAKFGEYALLAPATAVLVADARALRRLLGTVAVLTLAAALVGLLQFCGLKIFEAWPPSAYREPSFAGLAPLGALGATALAVGFVELLWPGSIGRRTMLACLGAGTVCLVVSGEAAGGVALGAVAIVSLLVVGRLMRLPRRGAALLAALTLVCALGLVGLRGGDIAQFGRYVGVLSPNRATTANVQTYAQRTLMYYIALRVFESHVLLGAGWQSMRETQVYSPVLPAAHREFPNQPAQAFPAPDHTWAVDDAYIQSLAELGILGTALFVGLLVTALRLGVVRTLRGPPAGARVALLGLLWLLVAMGIWAGQGLTAGVAFAALPWFGIGLIATAPASGSPGETARAA